MSPEPPLQDTGQDLSDRRFFDSRKAICLILFFATIAAFWPLHSSQFIYYDDPDYITGNPWVQSGLTPQGVVWAFGHSWSANWHPLTWISHMLDVTLFGRGPMGPHLVNLFLHVCNVILLFLALEKTTDARWPSAFVAALFAWHPLHVESVAWISERKDVLSAFFFMLCLRSYLNYAGESLSSSHSAGRTNSQGLRWLECFRSSQYGLALLFLGLGLLSKPMLVTVPFVLLLLDFWPLGRWRDFGVKNQAVQQLIVEKVPFFVLSLISCIVTFLVQTRSGAVHGLKGLSLAGRFENAAVSYARYLEKIFWPADLAIPYPHPAHWPLRLTIFSGTVVLGLSAAAWLSRRRVGAMFIGWFWFLGMLVPVIGLVQVGMQSMADRYTYLPAIGIFIAVTWLWAAVWRALSLPGWSAACLAVPVLLALGTRTHQQALYWKDSGTLFRHTLEVTKNNFDAHLSLGTYFDDKNNFADALAEYLQALRIYTNDAPVLNKIGSLYARQNKDEQAIRYYREAIQANPDFSDPHGNLGVIFRRRGELDQAAAEFREALRLWPRNAEAHNNLGNLLMTQGKVDEAVEQYRLAVENSPGFGLALDNLAWALARQGHFTEAVTYGQRAIKAEPNNAHLHASFGDLLLRLNREKDAVEQGLKAVQLAPDSVEARLVLGRAFIRVGSRYLAVPHLREALRLEPDNAEARKELEAATAQPQ